MAILEKEVLLTLHNQTIRHYEELGYTIPRKKNKWGELVVARGTKILVATKDLTKGSNIVVTKVCDICLKHIPKQKINKIMNSRKSGDGLDRCEECSYKIKVASRQNNIEYTNSLEYFSLQNSAEYLLEEYSKKNKKTANDISYGTSLVVLWNCNICDSEYDMSVSKRTAGRACPYCSGRRVNHTNCLWTTRPDIAFLLKNKDRGYKVTAGSNKKEEFFCVGCNDIKTLKINDVSNQGVSCSKCNFSKGEETISEYFNNKDIEFVSQHTFEDLRCKALLKLDFYLIKGSLSVEYDGKQHFELVDFAGKGERWAQKQFEDIQAKDKLKNQYCINNNIPLIRIPYWEFDNIEYILDNVLKYFNIIEGECEDSSIVEKYYVRDGWCHDTYISWNDKNKR